tara:strand:+ start:242 stop:481 length:240 start_codon:yes stop_codon:yes gene_type:complete
VDKFVNASEEAGSEAAERSTFLFFLFLFLFFLFKMDGYNDSGTRTYSDSICVSPRPLGERRYKRYQEKWESQASQSGCG